MESAASVTVVLDGKSTTLPLPADQATAWLMVRQHGTARVERLAPQQQPLTPPVPQPRSLPTVSAQAELPAPTTPQ